MPPTDPLRQRIRAGRRALSDGQRRQAAQAMADRVRRLHLFGNSDHIAAYLAFDGEMDPHPLVERAWSMGKSVYLPVLTGTPPRHLLFAPYRPDDELVPNRFGIPEPRVAEAELTPPQRLDLVLTPLVAFDEACGRMGMGGGFYDRSFAFLNTPGHIRKPRLLGLAYELQKTVDLTPQPWDVALDGVVTEAALYRNPDRDDAFHPLDTA